MIHNVVQFGNRLCMSFESFGELHFRPTFDTGAVRRCIAIVRAIQADCLASDTCADADAFAWFALTFFLPVFLF